MTDALDLAALRKMAEEAVRKGRVGYPGVPISPEFLLSLLDQIDEWEATDKANADERKQLLDRIEELEREVSACAEFLNQGAAPPPPSKETQ